MDKFVQRQPKKAQVDDSITNSSSISVAIELLPEVSSGPIDIPKRDTRIRTTGEKNIVGSYTLRKNITCFVGTASGLVNQGKSSPQSSPKLHLLRRVFLTGKRP